METHIVEEKKIAQNESVRVHRQNAYDRRQGWWFVEDL